MPATIITLTTDLGNKDHYVPSVKGVLMGKLPSANIVDITHRIAPFNIAEASFILKGCYRDFPEGTIHLVSVDSDDNVKPNFILVKTKGQYIIAADNGFVPLVLDEEPMDAIISIPFHPGDLVFPLKNIMAPIACQLHSGIKLNDIGPPLKDIVRKAHLRPVLEENFIRGTVVYVDNLGNAITNIEQSHFARYGENRKFSIYISRREYFDTISKYYTQVPEGEKVCLFGSGGLMEIAINKGNGSGLLGLKTGHPILIEFE